MGEIQIRPYEHADAPRVRRICIENAGRKARRDDKTAAMILDTFCNYYIEREPFNCFVADGGEGAVGYILCAESFAAFKPVFYSEYLSAVRRRSPLLALGAWGSIWFERKYARKYPAHLHIDIFDGCQRMGIGTRLMDALVDHLRQKGTAGVMLTVGAGNEKGVSFYKKYGFTPLGKLCGGLAMGLSLAEKDSP